MSDQALERLQEAARLAVELLPEIIETVEALLSMGRTPEDIRRDIRDRRAETRRMWERYEAELLRKYGGG